MHNDKNKGLADNQDGEFILNESGTSVTIDADKDFAEDSSTNGEQASLSESNNKKTESTGSV